MYPGVSQDFGMIFKNFIDKRALASIGVTDVFFELFDATHNAIEYRYPIGLKYLAERLSP
jgi:hypothetical protein